MHKDFLNTIFEEFDSNQLLYNQIKVSKAHSLREIPELGSANLISPQKLLNQLRNNKGLGNNKKLNKYKSK